MKKIALLIIVFSALFMTGCEKLENLNQNPNNVVETHPQLLLTTVEWDAFQVAGVSPLFASRMVIQTDGEDVYQYYKWDRGSYDSYNNLRNITLMMEEAVRIGSPNYQALAKFFRAYYFYNLALTFGDVPYSQALKGETVALYSPEYDLQKDVFKGILQELKEAIEMMTDDIIDGDIIFAGDAGKWRKLINSFRLKVLITLSGKTDETDMNIIGTFADIVTNQPIMESNDDDGQLIFYDQLGSRYTEYNNSDYGSNRYMDSTFIRKLQDHEDPRLFVYCAQTKNAKETGLDIADFLAYEGGNPIAPYNEVNLKAAAGNVSKVNLRYTTDPTCEPHRLMSYAELQLILAEASVRGWIDPSDAETYYEEGVKASFDFYNTYAKEYSGYFDDAAAHDYLVGDLVDFSNAANDEARIERIIMQKYLQSFLQGGWSAYFDKLRTGFPDFILLPGITPPARWMYPNSEYQLNAENVSAAIERQFGAGNDKIRETTWWLK
ncbi:MAG: SusD/RagB family nutrient-binding outer membrane lipoprotein [Bacteroidales bacterium]|nr:SusD/RagB family nutrient-binding outer membrane lipoprotein [Bacteroidales bacterium]